MSAHPLKDLLNFRITEVLGNHTEHKMVHLKVERSHSDGAALDVVQWCRAVFLAFSHHANGVRGHTLYQSLLH
jgi:hypothetical protein